MTHPVLQGIGNLGDVPALWLAQGPPTRSSPRTYGWGGRHGYNPISIGQAASSGSWLSDPCHVMWLIAGAAAAAASAATTYAMRKKEKKGRR